MTPTHPTSDDGRFLCDVDGCSRYPHYISRFARKCRMWCEVHAFVFAVDHFGAQWARDAESSREQIGDDEEGSERTEEGAEPMPMQMEFF